MSNCSPKENGRDWYEVIIFTIDRYEAIIFTIDQALSPSHSSREEMITIDVQLFT
jgi:hypothetical protein